MSVNQENFEPDGSVSGDGGHDIPREYDKPEYTKEQRAHLNAAMLGMLASTFIFFQCASFYLALTKYIGRSRK
jgi:hypothetical protein